MKNIYALVIVALLLVANKLQSQNEELVIWKNGVAIYTQSTNPSVMDSITFRQPIIDVAICGQVWATRNLEVITYRNGDLIPQVTDPTQWASLTTGAWCYYNNDPANGPIYGKLYNWYAVNDPRGLEPNGWHVPSDGEWTTLINCLGGELAAGGKMKAITLWDIPSAATNSSGFTGFPGGYCYSNGYFQNITEYGAWWSSSESGIPSAWGRSMYYLDGGVDRQSLGKKLGISVRCLRN